MDTSRGSEHILAKLLGTDKRPTSQELATLITTARTSGYHIVDWHIKGVPAIERITAELEVTKEKAPEVVRDLLGVHSEHLAVNFRVFPKGIPVLEIIRIEVNAERSVR